MTDPIRAALERLHQYSYMCPEHDTDEIVAAARAALSQPVPEPVGPTDDEPPPGPFSEHDLRQQWNQQADEFNQWDSLDSSEQLAWAQVRAIAADRARWGRPAPPAAGEVAVLSDAELESVARVAEIQNMEEQGGLTASDPNGVQVQLQCQRLAGLRAVEAATITRTAALLERFSASQAPVPVAAEPTSGRGMGLNEYLQMASQCVSALAGELLTLIEARQITGSDAVIAAMAIGRLQAAEDALEYIELPEGGMADQQDGVHNLELSATTTHHI